MTSDKNSLVNRLRLPGPDPVHQTSPAATDRLTQFNSRRLAFFGTMADECIAHQDHHPGTDRERALLVLLEIRSVVGEGIGYA